jgi:hypothetical protein
MAKEQRAVLKESFPQTEKRIRKWEFKKLG